MEQADWLDRMMDGTGGLDAVVLLRAPNRIVLERALQLGRNDDTEEIINKRLEIYRQNAEALLRFYLGQVESIDGNRPVQIVHP